MARGGAAPPPEVLAAAILLVWSAGHHHHVVTGLISCQQIGLKQLNQEGHCENATSFEHFRIINSDSDQVVIVPSRGVGDTKICWETASSTDRPEASWYCQTPKFVLSAADQEIFSGFHRPHRQLLEGQQSRATRSAQENAPSPPPSKKGVQFSLIEIGGVSWVCEQLSELQCKPLWPKEVETPKETVKSGKQLDREVGSVFSSSWDLQNQVSAIVNDRDWSQERGRQSGTASGSASNEFVILEDDLNWQSSENGTQQAVYNINGITWLCRQQDQLQCFPVFSPWDESAPVGGSPGSVTIADRRELIDEDQGYPDFPAHTEASAGFTQPKDFIYTNQRAEPDTGRQRKKTTFCARIIRFVAKDEVLLKFDSYSGTRSLYLGARRAAGQEPRLIARMLQPGEQGLGTADNSPSVSLDTEVNCDTISIRVDGLLYKIDYNFGRDGVRDLEVVGNLESTGMVPRDLTNQNTANSVVERSLNYMYGDYQEVVELIPQPPPGLLLTDDLLVDDGDTSNNVYNGDTQGRTGQRGSTATAATAAPSSRSTTSPFPRPDTTAAAAAATAPATTPAQTTAAVVDRPIPVVQDNFQVVGTGDVVISLAETENITHLYKISKADTGDVNVEIVGSGANQAANRSLIIDNKDYNYTLIITGTTFQIIHHDTNKNATYTHGLEDSHIAGVGVRGDVSSNQISFKEPGATVVVDTGSGGQSRAFPLTQEQSQPLDIYGNLCVQPCSLASDGSYWCEVAAGGSRKCGPAPGFTPKGDRCQGDCRKRNDDYYWCHLDGKPWDYCSPPLFLRTAAPACSPTATDRTYTPDEGDCARYLVCEQGNIRLDECPEGLHYYQVNRTCQWPALVNCRPKTSISSASAAGATNSATGGASTLSVAAVDSIAAVETSTPTAAGAATQSAAVETSTLTAAVTATRSAAVASTLTAAEVVTASAVETSSAAAAATKSAAIDSSGQSGSVPITLGNEKSDSVNAEVNDDLDGAASTTLLTALQRANSKQPQAASASSGIIAIQEINLDSSSNASKESATAASTREDVLFTVPLILEETSTAVKEATGGSSTEAAAVVRTEAAVLPPSETAGNRTSESSATGGQSYQTAVTGQSIPVITAVSDATGVTSATGDRNPNIGQSTLSPTAGASDSSAAGGQNIQQSTDSPAPGLKGIVLGPSVSPSANNVTKTDSATQTDDNEDDNIITDIIVPKLNTSTNTVTPTTSTTSPSSAKPTSATPTVRAPVPTNTVTARRTVTAPPPPSPTGRRRVIQPVFLALGNNYRLGTNLASLGNPPSNNRVNPPSGSGSNAGNPPPAGASANGSSRTQDQQSEGSAAKQTPAPAAAATGRPSVNDNTANETRDGTGGGGGTEDSRGVPRALWTGGANSLGADGKPGSNTSATTSGAGASGTAAGGAGNAVSSAGSTSGRPGAESLSTADIVNLAENFTGGLTSYGEVCLDSCEKRGYSYFWCHKKTSKLGQWWDSDFCSPTPVTTHYGEACKDPCEQRGEAYFWCNKKAGGWGYCSPNPVYTKGLCGRQDQYLQRTDLYAIYGDCERYITCRAGQPVPSSCSSGLYFDYILQSCTFQKDARCVGSFIG